MKNICRRSGSAFTTWACAWMRNEKQLRPAPLRGRDCFPVTQGVFFGAGVFGAGVFGEVVLGGVILGGFTGFVRPGFFTVARVCCTLTVTCPDFTFWLPAAV